MLPWAVLSFRGRGALTPPLIRVVALWPILMGFLHYVLVGCPFPHTSDGVEGMAFFHPLMPGRQICHGLLCRLEVGFSDPASHPCGGALADPHGLGNSP